MNHDSKLEEANLFEWLRGVLASGDYDVLITVERKATALVRALIDLSPDIPIDWSWKKVLSSDALPYLPPNYLKGKRILVFNEMIHKGSSTLKTIQAVEKNTPGAQRFVFTAAFFVHSDFDHGGCWTTSDFRTDRQAPSPDLALERGVSERLYPIYRDRMLDILRSRGALLLDTEHIESTFNHTLPHREFVDALMRFGSPVEYRWTHSNSFPGVTIRSPYLVDSEELKSHLPPGTHMDENGPKKIRLVRRGAKKFAFIPIWYPPVPINSVTKPADWKSAPPYIKPALDACPEENLPGLVFHLTSLVTGIDLLRSVWMGLSEVVKSGIEPDVLAGSEGPGSPLGHLRALYPFLDFNMLEKEINGAISSYKLNKESKIFLAETRWAQRKTQTAGKVDAQNLRMGFKKLFRRLMLDAGRFTLGEGWYDGFDLPSREKNPIFTWSAIRQVALNVQIPEAIRSVIMDVAIDNAYLKTSHATGTIDGIDYFVRAFEPDSEFARDALERLAHGAEDITAA